MLNHISCNISCFRHVCAGLKDYPRINSLELERILDKDIVSGERSAYGNRSQMCCDVVTATAALGLV
jgi:hypothetical protein